MVSAMSDLGIALDFHLTSSTPQDGENRSLGIDLFEESWEEKMGPLVDSCACFTCKEHHAAYLHHLLKCHEMTAWVLLQMFSSSLPQY